MNKLIIALTIAIMSITPALAHPDGHDVEEDGMVQKTIPEMAHDVVLTLISKAALESSWGTSAPEKTEAQMMGSVRIWVVSFRNDKEKDAAKRNLYIKLNNSGAFLSSSHTGP